MKRQVLSVLFCLVFITGYAQRDTSDNRMRDAIAARSLNGLRTSLNDRNMRNFGFSSVDDVQSASLGHPYQIYIIPLNVPREYTTSMPISSLVRPTSRYIYPVLNNKTNQLITDMGVDKQGNNWTVVNFNKNKRVIYMALVQSHVISGNISIINIPAFSLDFVSYYANNTLMMIPVVADPQNRLEAGQAVPAQRVFSAYSQAAKTYNGLPM